jgi:hypothetical protein
MLGISGMWEITIMSIGKILQEHTDRLMSIPGVVGVAEGENAGKPVIRVMVSELTPELRDQLPRAVGGIPVEIDKTGEINAL